MDLKYEVLAQTLLTALLLGEYSRMLVCVIWNNNYQYNPLGVATTYNDGIQIYDIS